MAVRHAHAILVLAFANMATATGITLGFSVFYVALLEEFGGSRSGTAAIFSVLMLAQGLASPPIGAVHDRLGARAQTVGGAVLLGGGLLASAAVTAPWQLHLTYGLLVGLGAAALTWVGMAPILATWFQRRLATVNAIAYAGMGVGTIALVPLLSWLIARIGWRPAFVILGLAVLACVAPANYRLQRPPRPDEVAPAPKGAAATASTEPTRATLHTALRTGDFWGLAAEFFGISFGIFLIAAHQVAFAVDAGFDRLAAASAVGVVGLTSGVGRFLFGAGADIVGKQAALGASFLCSIGGIALLLAAGATGQPWLLWAYALVFGLGFGARGPILAADAAARFSGPRFGTIFGAITVFHGLGSAAGPFLGGLLFDLDGSYTLPFGLAMLALAGSWALSHWLLRRRPGS